MPDVPAFNTIFGHTKPVIGVIHLPPLPGSPRYGGDLAAIGSRVRRDARALAAGGASGMILENFGDAPFHRDRVEPAVIAAMTTFALIAREATDLPLGVNVLRNDAEGALAVALAGSAAFIRVNVHVGAAVTDQGLITGRAADTMRLRRNLDAGIAVFADVGVKHATPVTPRPIEEEAEEAVGRGLADALIVTGSMTGAAIDLTQLRSLRRLLPDVPLLAGSGVTADTAPRILELADGLIVGTAVKEGGQVEAPVDPAAVERLARAAQAARD